MTGIGARPDQVAGRSPGVRHLYVHLPFCSHRCGYCDFVTVVGRRSEHGRYAEALRAELELERGHSGLETPPLTVFVGGGTPTFTEPEALARILAALPRAAEVTVEANPETVTSELARLLRDAGVTRVSVGAQSFSPHLLGVLERRAGPDDVRRAVHTLRDVNFDNISLDLVYGIPGQSAADLERDLAEAIALHPEHVSCYELEAKPGTRFTRAHGEALDRQAEAMEGYFETVVAVLTAAGYRWYETANFCLTGERAAGRDLRAHHNLAYWHGCDYLGLGVGAVSTVGGRRWRNTPSLARYVDGLLADEPPPRAFEGLDRDTQARERVMLGLRLDEPLALDGIEHVVDTDALARLVARGLVEHVDVPEPEAEAGAARAPRADARRGRGRGLRLTPRGRFLGGGVTAELLA